MHSFSDFGEVKKAVGSEVGASEWIDITQERINLFTQATCDEQWIHVDQQPAKTGASGRHDDRSQAAVAQSRPDVHSVRDGHQGTSEHLELWYPLRLPRRGRLTDQGPHHNRGSTVVPPDGLRINYYVVIEIEGGQRPAGVVELIALHYR
jgi:hypothetical protein